MEEGGEEARASSARPRAIQRAGPEDEGRGEWRGMVQREDSGALHVPQRQRPVVTS